MTDEKQAKAKLPDKIGLADKQCKDHCKYEKCDRTWLTIGNYYEGSGFSPEEADELIKCWNFHDRLILVVSRMKEFFDLSATDSFCECCEQHAPKDPITGEINGDITHADDCWLNQADEILAELKGAN